MLMTETFIRGLPKTDLHMHLEGSIEPELMLDLAARNGIPLRWENAEALRAAYSFENLESFLALYFEGCKVLVTDQDFYDLTRSYLHRAHEDGVIRSELYFGPQSFTERGIPIETLMSALLQAIQDARNDTPMSVGLIISVHRHRTEAEALAVLDQIMPWSDQIIAMGMGGPEIGNPPSKFARFFQACQARGFRTTVHAGEEGPASYVREALEILKTDRIDHGVTCVHDPDLVVALAERKIPLTVCPVSNLRLNGVASLQQHPLKEMLAKGLHVTVNSDDPPYFGAYATENLLACQQALDLSLADVITLVRNGFQAAFVTHEEREMLLGRLDAYLALQGVAPESPSSTPSKGNRRTAAYMSFPT